jgi:tRNA(fMet)-specific endonuclease VapC
MEGFLLDTSAPSAYLNPAHQHHAAAVETIDALPQTRMKLVSIVTLGEFQFGLAMAEAADSEQLPVFRERLAALRHDAPLDMTRHAAAACAALKRRLARRVQARANQTKPSRRIEDWIDAKSGKRLQIDENDLWIAAQAKERDLTVISGDRDMEALTAVDAEARLKLRLASEVWTGSL